MKKIVVAIFALSVMFTTINAQTFDWARQISSVGTAQGLSVSSNGSDVYSTGSFTANTDFDPGAASLNLSTQGGHDIFVQKLDQNGNFLWAKRIGGTGNDLGRIINNYGTHVIVSGTFSGTVDFDPGSGTQSRTSNGGTDVFVLALDGSGNFLWVNTFGGTGNESVGGQEKDNYDYVVVTGGFYNSMVVPTVSSNQTVTATGGSSKDVYLMKMTLATGAINWVKTFGGPSIDSGTGLTIKANRNIVLVGGFYNTIDANPGAGITSLTSTGNVNVFIAEFDAFGVFVDAFSFPNASTMEAYDIALDNSENIYITGPFKISTDFDPKAGVTTITSNGDQDCYIVKLNPSKNLIWAKTFGGPLIDQPFGIEISPNGDVYTAGRFRSTVDFDPGTAVNNVTSNSYNIFLHKLNSNGDFLSVQNFGATGSDMARGLDIDVNGNMFVNGTFASVVDFDPTAGVTNFSTIGNTLDGFLLKYSNLCATFSTDAQTACVSYTWIDGTTYTSSNNTATHTLTNSIGCDSIVTLNLTINNATAGTDVQAACSSYTWINGTTYTSSNNTATHTLTNSLGCDSVVTLNLTIQANASTDSHSACSSYTWINGITYTSSNNTATFTSTNVLGCDSVIHLNLTIYNGSTFTDIHSACNSYTWINGTTYTSSNNTATHTLTNSLGCDSVLLLNLTINNATTGTTIKNACSSYTWINGTTYTSSNNTATHTLTNAAGCDSVVTLNLTINNPNTGIDVQNACSSYTWINGTTYTSSNNTATYTTTNVAGCDSVVTLNLSINANTGTDVEAACDSYVWIDGNTYTSSNNSATHTLTNVSGCDSVVTLNLTINNSNTGTDIQTACDSYTWINGMTYTSSNNSATYTTTNIAGCDSVVTLNLTINNSNTGIAVQAACDSYTWIDGNTYTSSNNSATHTLTNVSGCDSVVTLDLTITNSTTSIDEQTACESYTWIDGMTYTVSNNSATYTLTNTIGCDSVITLDLTINSIDVSTTVDGLTITANNASATSYQWINCADNSIILDETNVSFTATKSGDYAVIITENACSDTSDCVSVSTVGINDLAFENISVYPNPTNGLVNLNVSEELTSISIMDLTGKTIQVFNAESTQLDISNFTAGIYFLEIANAERKSVVKIIKK